jgi:hypothetical protein
MRCRKAALDEVCLALQIYSHEPSKWPLTSTNTAWRAFDDDELP